MLKGYSVLIIPAGLMLAIIVLASAFAAAPPDATYVGSDKCLMCHQAMHKNIVDGWKTTGHSKPFADALKNPEAIKAQFDADAPLSKDQIKYVLGSGRTRQAYVGADFKTLPGEWNTVTNKWEESESVDAKTQCIGCHVLGFKATDSSWTEPAVGCESCHGPGSVHMETADETKIVNPKRLPNDRRAMVCAHCHSKGTDSNKTRAFSLTYKPGDDLAQTFTLSAVEKGKKNQQHNAFITSKHAAGGMRCETCHEPHGAGTTQPTQLVRPVNELCLGCHTQIKSMKDHAPEAADNANCATPCHMPDGSHAFVKTTM